MTKTIVESLGDLVGHPGGPSHAWVSPYAEDGDAAHQFVLFLKPEATAVSQGVDLARFLGIVFDTLAEWDVKTSGTRVLRGDYLSLHRIMDNHYGVINRISHQGRSTITPQAEEKLTETFSDLLGEGAKVLGGHQFLEQVPGFTPLTLSVLSDNVGTTKLGGGTYGLRANVLGQWFVILNPFHPYQLEPYYAPTNAIVVLECHSDKPWAELRQKLAGATNPLKAVENSIRNRVLQQKNELGMADVSQGANGIHLSAGPLEGMVEIQRFFADHEADTTIPVDATTFGRRLLKHGLDTGAIETLAGNPTLDVDGSPQSAFDLTEEVDADTAAETLCSAVGSATN